MIKFIFSFVAWAPVVALSAQAHVVVPMSHASVPGNTRSQIPGVVEAKREQLIVDPVHLVPILGRDITALEFRRWRSPEAYLARQASISVALSAASHNSIQASELYAANAGPNPVTVFNGLVNVPASPVPGAGPDLWGPQDVVRIAFQAPYHYTGGPICIDIIGSPAYAGGPLPWTGDAVRLDQGFAVAPLGPGTGATANDVGEWLFIEKDELVAGGRAKLLVLGPPNGIVLGFVGRPAVHPLPLSLVGIPTPGAFAYIDEFYLSTFALLVPPPIPVTTSGMADWDVPLPAEPWMLGVTLAAQFLELTHSDVSNGIQWTVSSAMPSLGMAQISGVASEPAGDRTINVAHILRFEYTPP